MQANILAGLTNIPSGDIAHHQTLDYLEPPVIRVEDIGLVNLPLCVSQARELAQIARLKRLKQCGTDWAKLEFPPTWILTAEELSFTNPKWSAYLQVVITKCTANLGVDPEGVEARLYGMLLWETNSLWRNYSK